MSNIEGEFGTPAESVPEQYSAEMSAAVLVEMFRDELTRIESSFDGQLREYLRLRDEEMRSYLADEGDEISPNQAIGLWAAVMVLEAIGRRDQDLEGAVDEVSDMLDAELGGMNMIEFEELSVIMVDAAARFWDLEAGPGSEDDRVSGDGSQRDEITGAEMGDKREELDELDNNLVEWFEARIWQTTDGRDVVAVPDILGILNYKNPQSGRSFLVKMLDEWEKVRKGEVNKNPGNLRFEGYAKQTTFMLLGDARRVIALAIEQQKLDWDAVERELEANRRAENSRDSSQEDGRFAEEQAVEREMINAWFGNIQMTTSEGKSYVALGDIAEILDYESAGAYLSESQLPEEFLDMDRPRVSSLDISDIQKRDLRSNAKLFEVDDARRLVGWFAGRGKIRWDKVQEIILEFEPERMQATVVPELEGGELGEMVAWLIDQRLSGGVGSGENRHVEVASMYDLVDLRRSEGKYMGQNLVASLINELGIAKILGEDLRRQGIGKAEVSMFYLRREDANKLIMVIHDRERLDVERWKGEFAAGQGFVNGEEDGEVVSDDAYFKDLVVLELNRISEIDVPEPLAQWMTENLKRVWVGDDDQGVYWVGLAWMRKLIKDEFGAGSYLAHRPEKMGLAIKSGAELGVDGESSAEEFVTIVDLVKFAQDIERQGKLVESF